MSHERRIVILYGFAFAYSLIFLIQLTMANKHSLNKEPGKMTI